MLREHFKKTTAIFDESARLPKEQDRPHVPDGMFQRCDACGNILYEEDVQENRYCCPECGKHFRIGPWERIRLTADGDSFEEWDAGLTGEDPLKFPGYREKLELLREKTGLSDAVVTGRCTIRGQETAIGAMSPDFLMGSMGTAVGERITRMIERATRERLPIVLFCCSGGARMQEGIFSLMQMAKTAQALRRHDDAGLLYVPVLTDPTTGGVTASFAMLGDLILAEPGALIGFAGARVIRQTIGQKLPDGFQSAEFLQKHGFVDRIVRREQMRRTLATILRSSADTRIAGGITAGPSVRNIGEGKPEWNTWNAGNVAPEQNMQNIGEEESKLQKTEEVMTTGTEAYPGEPEEPGVKVCPGGQENSGIEVCPGGQENSGIEVCPGESESSEGGETAWDHVLAARSSRRPVTSDYLARIFDGFLELRGDRLYGDDRAVIGGLAVLDGQYVTVIGQQKGRNARENRHRNFGMPNPEGYRKALRLMRQAEKFSRPIILFVDTPGAFCGVEAEERGQGEAIARSLFGMAGLTVPVLSIVIGEGGSGGALAFAVANEVWMLENAVYSVLSPEGFAAILWKDGTRAAEAAEVMKMTAADLKAAGIIEKIIPEPAPADREAMEELAEHMKREIRDFLARYSRRSPEEIAKMRYQRFRSLGTPPVR